MKAIRQFALIMAVLLPLVAPAMACVLPGARMTPAERDCCRHMASQCGHMQMPAAQNCCQKDVPTADQWNAMQLPSAHAYTGLGATAALPLVARLQLPSDLPRDAVQQSLTLPQSPPVVFSILRI